MVRPDKDSLVAADCKFPTFTQTATRFTPLQRIACPKGSTKNSNPQYVAGTFCARRVYAARIAHVLALTEYAVLKQQRDGPFGSVPLVVTSSSRAFAPFVRCQFLSARKLLSLLSEPLVAVLSVYGELEPARPVLVGFELENDIVRPKRMIIPYRMQLARISVRLHRKQRFGPLLVQPDILAVIFPFQQPLYIGTQLIDTHQGFYDLLCFLFKVGHLFIVSGLHGLDLLLQLPDALILVGNYPLQICNLFFIPRGLGVVEQRSDPFYGFRRGIHGHAL